MSDDDRKAELDRHDEQADRLWRAVRRDLGAAILFMAGFTKDEAATRRLEKTWAKLCAHDVSIASSLYHGVEQLHVMMGRDGVVPAHREAMMNEVLGLAEIARERHPDAVVETVGELIDLAEETIRAEIDAETDEP